MRRERWLLIGAAVIAFGLSAPLVRAEPTAESPAQAEVPAVPPAEADLAAWVRELGGADFDARREATRRLVESGKFAVEPVAKAAAAANPETAGRCIEVLKRIFNSDNAAAKQAAEAALGQLAKSDNVAVAQRAAAAIAKPEPVPQIGRFGGNVQIQIQVGGAVPIARPNLEREVTVEENGKKIHIKEIFGKEIVVKVTESIDGKEKTTEFKAANRAELLRKHKEAFELAQKHLRGAALRPKIVVNGQAVPVLPAAGNFKMQVRTVNGAREIEVEQDGRKVQISDRDGKDIAIKVARTVDGKEQTDEYKAKDLDELKQKHPEGAKIYEQYGSGRNGVFRINGGAIQIQGVPGRAIPLPLPAIPIQVLPVIPEKEDQPAKP